MPSKFQFQPVTTSCGEVVASENNASFPAQRFDTLKLTLGCVGTVKVFVLTVMHPFALLTVKVTGKSPVEVNV